MATIGNVYVPYTNRGFTASLGDVTIGEIQKITGLNLTAVGVETTAIASTDGFKRFAATLKGIGEFTVTVYVTAAVRTHVHDLMLDTSTGSDKFYTDLTLNFPPKSGISAIGNPTALKGYKFGGFVKSVKDGDYVTNELMTMDIVFRPSGKPVELEVTTYGAAFKKAIAVYENVTEAEKDVIVKAYNSLGNEIGDVTSSATITGTDNGSGAGTVSVSYKYYSTTLSFNII